MGAVPAWVCPGLGPLRGLAGESLALRRGARARPRGAGPRVGGRLGGVARAVAAGVARAVASGVAAGVAHSPAAELYSPWSQAVLRALAGPTSPVEGVLMWRCWSLCGVRPPLRPSRGRPGSRCAAPVAGRAAGAGRPRQECPRSPRVAGYADAVSRIRAMSASSQPQPVLRLSALLVLTVLLGLLGMHGLAALQRHIPLQHRPARRAPHDGGRARSCVRVP